MFECEISHSVLECNNRAPRTWSSWTYAHVLSVSNHLEGSTFTEHHIVHIVDYYGSISFITHGKVTWKPGKLIKNFKCEAG